MARDAGRAGLTNGLHGRWLLGIIVVLCVWFLSGGERLGAFRSELPWASGRHVCVPRYGIRLYDSLLFRASRRVDVELVRRRRELLDDNVHLLAC